MNSASVAKSRISEMGCHSAGEMACCSEVNDVNFNREIKYFPGFRNEKWDVDAVMKAQKKLLAHSVDCSDSLVSSINLLVRVADCILYNQINESNVRVQL